MSRILRPAIAGMALAGATSALALGPSLTGAAARPLSSPGRSVRPLPKAPSGRHYQLRLPASALPSHYSVRMVPHVRMTSRPVVGPVGPAQSGVASYYDTGSVTADGEAFDPGALTAASPTLPFGTLLRVCSGAACTTVRVNDRGPYVPGRFLDLTPAGAAALGYQQAGTADVTATPVAEVSVPVRVVTTVPELVPAAAAAPVVVHRPGAPRPAVPEVHGGAPAVLAAQTAPPRPVSDTGLWLAGGGALALSAAAGRPVLRRRRAVAR